MTIQERRTSKIRKEMISKFQKKINLYKEVPNRKKAIQYCINILGKNDFLLIAGKVMKIIK